MYFVVVIDITWKVIPVAQKKSDSMVTVAVLYVPSSNPLLPLSDALLFQEITVLDDSFLLLPINDINGLLLPTFTFSLHYQFQEKLGLISKFSNQNNI